MQALFCLPPSAAYHLLACPTWEGGEAQPLGWALFLGNPCPLQTQSCNVLDSCLANFLLPPILPPSYPLPPYPYLGGGPGLSHCFLAFLHQGGVLLALPVGGGPCSVSHCVLPVWRSCLSSRACLTLDQNGRYKTYASYGSCDSYGSYKMSWRCFFRAGTMTWGADTCGRWPRVLRISTTLLPPKC